MKSIKGVSFYNSRVIVRCDFNVPKVRLSSGKTIVDPFKIESCLKTVNYLKNSGAKIILISHFGRPLEKRRRARRKNYSLIFLKETIEKVFGQKIIFSEKIFGKALQMKIKKMKPGQIILLENLRFKKGEEENSKAFAQKLAALADSYVNEAFSVCHRQHASIVSLPKLLPSFAGIQLQEEIEALSKILKRPKKPLVVVVGGSKTYSKLKMVKPLLKTSAHILFGGKISRDILTVKGISIGPAWPDEKSRNIIEKIDITNPKIHLPVDVVVSPNAAGNLYVRETAPGSVRKEEDIFDIGEETIKTFSKIIRIGRTIFWCGPLGFFENKKFSKGTEKIAKAIAGCGNAFKVAGGGSTISAIRSFGLADKYSFLSAGGGAMLAFLSGEKLPGIEALE